MFLLILEREEGKERNINWLPPVHSWTQDHMCPDGSSDTQPRYVSGLGIEPAAFQLRDDAPTN